MAPINRKYPESPIITEYPYSIASIFMGHRHCCLCLGFVVYLWPSPFRATLFDTLCWNLIGFLLRGTRIVKIDISYHFDVAENRHDCTCYKIEAVMTLILTQIVIEFCVSFFVGNFVINDCFFYYFLLTNSKYAYWKKNIFLGHVKEKTDTAVNRWMGL